MSKKKYPVISLFIAIVWAVFFYPADRAPAVPQATKALAGAPAVAAKAPEQRTASLSGK